MTLAGGGASSDPLSAGLAGIPMWAVMTLAMTAPGLIPVTQHVAVNSFKRRQSRAVAEFLTAYLGLWLAFGSLAIGLLSMLPFSRSYYPLSAALALAAIWELTPVKRWALNRCHRSSPLPPHGFRASAGVFRFAWIHGSGCIGSCWMAMGAMLLAPGARLAWALGLTGLTSYEKLTRRPRRAARRAAALLGAAAAGVLLGALAAQ
jgi:predicted metal-binding membrane protein